MGLRKGREDVNYAGILFVDKAEGWTSHDAVAKARRALGTRKVGHAGTLDPMATGLLTLGVGSATRLLTHMVGLDKTYTTTIRLGQSTLTDDKESEILSSATLSEIHAVSDAQIAHEVKQLTGEIFQTPSRVSAIKVEGRRAYERVRAGEEVELKARPVTIHSFEVHSATQSTLADGTALIDIDATIRCSSGTYIRALARDLGAALQVGGHLIALRRTAVGPFQLADHIGNAQTPVEAVSTEALSAGVGADFLVDPATVASVLMPTCTLSEQQEIDLGHGKSISVQTPDAPLVAAVSQSGRLVGLVSVRQGATKVVTNFPTPQ